MAINPGDKRRADQIARDFTADALSVIVDVMQDPLSDPKERLKAAEMLLERGEGKVAQAIIALPASKKLIELTAAMTDEDLYAVIETQPLPRLGAPTQDAEFEPVADRGTAGNVAGSKPFTNADGTDALGAALFDPNDPLLQ